MKKIIISVITLTFALSSLAMADDSVSLKHVRSLDKQDRKEYIQGLSNSQRQTLRQQRKHHFKNASPEQKAKIKAKRQEKRQNRAASNN
ncbi:hypothetical protein [Francisella sp. 19X1-34]|uniref:hypothetical protein n=1 Tax=Francisella sp. 19X1-34 TaxID=3087177 RepID=UPI002E32F27B|nr:hypothetical protein [Francisella sp. 19X1-34]MED7788632.1 hypothetical protein [Francisella sp. 19X1-34]